MIAIFLWCLAGYIVLGLLGTFLALVVSRHDSSGDGALGVFAISWFWPVALFHHVKWFIEHEIKKNDRDNG